MTRARHEFVVAMLALGLLGCASQSVVDLETASLEAQLKPIHDSAKACAPVELANAEARIVFARWDSVRGRGVSAKAHLDAAQADVAEAVRKSSGSACEGDRDGDGLSDAIDQCPDIPEDFDGELDSDGCPDVDRDGDKVPDDRDKCPSQAEDRDGFEDQDGCPEFDNDKDGLPDDFDQCPSASEDRDGFQDQDGCPDLDNDGDDVPDAEDRCPSTAGTKATGGCPDDYRLIVYRENQIELRQPIAFVKATAALLPQSNPVLDEIAAFLKQNPKVKLRIEGHTDSEGADDQNLATSKKVADNTKRYLVAKGVSAGKLTTEGKGETIPVDENDTEEGRAANRRVEFHILK
jgi:outer membrane protein OmpA-like peptidoglycan-associated protein